MCPRPRARSAAHPLPIDRVIVLPPASYPAELEQSLDARLDTAVTNLATAERLLEEAVTALRTGTKEKIVVEPTIERAFGRVRAAREELVRLRMLVVRE